MDLLMQQKNRNTQDAFMFGAFVLLLLGIGLTSLYSASYDKALRMGLPSGYFFNRQVVFALLGLFCAAVITVIPLSAIKSLIPLLLLSSFLLMLLTSFTSLGETRLGATRWIRIGSLSFQPSELVKVSVILYLANYLDKKREIIHHFWAVTVPVAVIFIAAGLILIQRDYSTTMVFLFLSFSILLIAGARISHLIYYLGLAGVPGLLMLITEEYRLKRVVGFIFKDIDPAGINYQVNISLDAIASGGLFGKGFGQGTYKLGKIPEVQSDFIFSSFAEEQGLIGVLLLIALFTGFAFLGFRGAAKHRESDRFMYIAGFGITHLIMWQVLLNLGVVSGFVPPTGIPLPFFSAGGTNLLMNLGMCGLLFKIILRTPTGSTSIISDDHRAGYSRSIIDFE